MCRHTFIHPDYPVHVDMSIVKDSKRRGRYGIPEYQFTDSGVLESTEHYEIEIELDFGKIFNEKMMWGTVADTNSSELLSIPLRKVIMMVLSGLQGTNYPISYPEQKEVLETYMKILWGDEYKESSRIFPKNFVGPSQYTLQINNIIPINANALIPNIRKHYTVTEKADGERKLFIDKNNKGNLSFNYEMMTPKGNKLSFMNSPNNYEIVVCKSVKNFFNEINNENNNENKFIVKIDVQVHDETIFQEIPDFCQSKNALIEFLFLLRT